MGLIGITGKTGCGKSKIGNELALKLNYIYIDIDKIGHKAIEDNSIIKKLCMEFSSNILDENNNIDRKKLGNIVFSNKDKMALLTNITWSYMENKLDNILKNNNNYIFDWALLPNVKYFDMCDIKILITSDDIIRKEKILKRDNISEEYLEKREKNTLDYSKFKFDYSFTNDYSKETLDYIINTILNNYNRQLKRK